MSEPWAAGMAKGNSVKGGAKAGKVTKDSQGAKGKGGKGKSVKRRNKPEKGAKGEPGKHMFGKGAGVPGGKKKKAARHKQLPGVAPNPHEVESDSEVDESAIEGLQEYAGYSNFLLDMDVNQLKEPTKPTAAGAEAPKEPAATAVSRRDKKKRKAEEREAARAGGLDRGSEEELSEGEDAEADYESRPRKAQKWEKKKAEALPVRSADGKWTVPERPEAQPGESAAEHSSDSADSSEDDELEEEMDDEEAEQAAAEVSLSFSLSLCFSLPLSRARALNLCTLPRRRSSESARRASSPRIRGWRRWRATRRGNKGSRSRARPSPRRVLPSSRTLKRAATGSWRCTSTTRTETRLHTRSAQRSRWRTAA